MRTFYLIAAIFGFILPYVFFVPFFVEHGFDFNAFIQQMTASQIARAVSMDLLVSCIVFWVLLYSEGRRLGMKHLWAYILINLAVGLSFALPVFLYVRQGRLARPA